MKRISWFTFAVFMAAFLGVPSSQAEHFASASDSAGYTAIADCVDADDCFDCCDGYRGSAIVFDAELLLFKYHRADGVRAGSFSNVPPNTTDDIDFNTAATPRFTLGYITDSGLGLRVRWWEYDQEGVPAFAATGVSMGVDTYTIDFEAFENVQLTNDWSIELSGGIRYNEFLERMNDPIPPASRLNAFTGFGGVLGLEATRSLGVWGALYGRGRGAILMDDKAVRHNRNVADDQNADLTNVVVGMSEIAIGYEYLWETRRGTLLRFRTGYEWQNWHNYSTSFTPITTAPGNAEASFAGPSDVGFSGLTLLVGLER